VPPSPSDVDLAAISQRSAGQQRALLVELLAYLRQRLDATTALVDGLESGLVFTNLVETDTVYGHRKDAAGFAAALERIDAAVADWLGRLRGDDLLVLTADHGCDITHAETDHTREHAPLLAVAAGVAGTRHDGPLADVGASALRWLAGAQAPELPGEAFV